MPITLSEGFTGHVTIEGSNDVELDIELFRQQITSRKDADTFMETYGTSVPGCSLLQATLIPVRTDNWKNFAKDLFLPTYVNHALKIDNFVLGVFASVFAAALDGFTFVPRLFSSPFRAIYNHRNPNEHPLIALIRNNPAFLRSINSGVVTIRMHWEDTDTNLPYRPTAKKSTFDGFARVAIKALPGIEQRSGCATTSEKFIKTPENQWVAGPASISSNSSWQYAC